MAKIQKECDWCGKTFIAARKDKRFCDVKCRQFYWQYRQLCIQARKIQNKYGNKDSDIHRAWDEDPRLHRLMARAMEIVDNHDGKIDVSVNIFNAFGEIA
jgi:hypothetical protein